MKSGAISSAVCNNAWNPKIRRKETKVLTGLSKLLVNKDSEKKKKINGADTSPLNSFIRKHVYFGNNLAILKLECSIWEKKSKCSCDILVLLLQQKEFR